MTLDPLPIEGAFVIHTSRASDDRGSFSRLICAEEAAALGIHAHVAQVNLSRNARRGTLRGMHYQLHPHGETKVVFCVRGGLFDVLVDVRRESSTHRAWCGVELTAGDDKALYLPVGIAHGFLTLVDHTEVLYLMGAPYRAEAAAGVRFDDPAFGIQWPEPVRVVSDRDRAYPDYLG